MKTTARGLTTVVEVEDMMLYTEVCRSEAIGAHVRVFIPRLGPVFGTSLQISLQGIIICRYPW